MCFESLKFDNVIMLWAFLSFLTSLFLIHKVSQFCCLLEQGKEDDKNDRESGNWGAFWGGEGLRILH